MGRNPKIWGSDAEIWRPERFFEDKNLASDKFKFVSFKAGPRECLGKRVAYLEAKTAAAVLLLEYNFALVNESKVKPGLSLTLCMRNNTMMMRVTRR